ncbi:MAG: OmpH family outer membrane protein [Brevinematia bacterium]
MKLLCRLCLLVVICVLLPGVLSYGYSKVEKIGVIDLVEVFDDFVERKEVGKEFSVYKKTSMEKLEKMKTEIGELRNKVVELSNSIVAMGTNVDPQLFQKYNDLLKEYTNKVDIYLIEAKKVEESLNKYRDSLKQYVYKDIMGYIKSYGDKNGFSIIFDTRGNLIYYSKGNDITSDLNKWIKVQEDAKKKY